MLKNVWLCLFVDTVQNGVATRGEKSLMISLAE